MGGTFPWGEEPGSYCSPTPRQSTDPQANSSIMAPGFIELGNGDPQMHTETPLPSLVVQSYLYRFHTRARQSLAPERK